MKKKLQAAADGIMQAVTDIESVANGISGDPTYDLNTVAQPLNVLTIQEDDASDGSLTSYHKVLQRILDAMPDDAS